MCDIYIDTHIECRCLTSTLETKYLSETGAGVENILDFISILILNSITIRKFLI